MFPASLVAICTFEVKLILLWQFIVLKTIWFDVISYEHHFVWVYLTATMSSFQWNHDISILDLGSLIQTSLDSYIHIPSNYKRKLWIMIIYIHRFSQEGPWGAGFSGNHWDFTCFGANCSPGGCIMIFNAFSSWYFILVEGVQHLSDCARHYSHGFLCSGCP